MIKKTIIAFIFFIASFSVGYFIDGNRLKKEIRQDEKLFQVMKDSIKKVGVKKLNYKPNLPLIDIRLSETMVALPFFMDKENELVKVQEGRWTISEDIIIPSGYEVVCNSGTSLNFIQGAKLLSRSPLRFYGEKENPIVVSSSDKTGGQILVLNPEEKSVFQNVVFDGLVFRGEESGITSAISFYESEVEFHNCSFKRNGGGDDFLNLIRSNFIVDKCVFEEVKSDGLDLDFSSGSVVNSVFKNVGNDSIDISGGMIFVQNVRVVNSGDKGISAGEESILDLENVVVESSEIGLTAKDNSVVVGSKLILKNNSLGFAVFQKKPEYGPAEINIKDFNEEGTKELYLLEKGSKLVINGMSLTDNSDSVRGKLYGVEYGKSSRK